MTDKRGPRAWIRVQLADDTLAHEVAEQIRTWKGQRQAAMHVVRSIRLYTALCRGDLSVLEEYFPGLTWMLGNRSAGPRRTTSAPAVVNVELRSNGEELAEALDGLGLDKLDF